MGPPSPPEPLTLGDKAGALRRSVETWCVGRFWIPRALLLLYLGYVGVRHLLDSRYGSLFDAINLGIHEGGHLLFSFFGQFIHVAGGTLLQLAAPIAAVFVFRKVRDYFGIVVCGVWLSTNFYDVATYMADARARALPLVTVGKASGPIIHDWNYLLGNLGLLSLDTGLAFLVRVLAFLLWAASLAAGAWMCWVMATKHESEHWVES